MHRREAIRRTGALALGTTAIGGCLGGASGEEADEVVAVGPDGRPVFDPGTASALRITTGTTVRWEWESDDHNVVVGSQPEAADWSGHEPVEDAGFSYTYTFDVPGEYHYWCTPHKALGMVADLTVSEG